MTDVLSISAFIRRNLPSMFSSIGYADRKKREKFTNWVSWSMGRMNVCVIPRGNKIIGVGIARSISKPVDSCFPYRFDERGDILYVHLAVAKDHEAFRALLAYCKFRWPTCTKIMFHRKKTKRMMTYDFKRFLEIIESKPLTQI
jgi:hypothetical protein